MSTVLGLCVLLILGSLGGAAASQVQIYGKSVYGGLRSGYVGRQTARGHLTRSPSKNTIHRSLDLEAFNLHVTPTASKISLPTIIRLYPPTAKPLHLHANMPLRFGRANNPAHDSPTNPNMPLRFGRNSDFAHNHHVIPNMPLRFGRDSDSAPDPSLSNPRALRFGRESDSTSGNTPTMPQRFGRAGKMFHVCPPCSDGEETQETQRDGLYWSLLRTIHSY
ncbi:pro-FMRFamide-related neuropeptide VF [Periophthalmus magnuspinnatus]|uniref:pro-FMRFamide-related neuropeptide VF n=1 Tax=Periophthalmus magnuspinnatus TaxID=409849 RepID=UPI0024366FB3|nr:pro-FMRFamide-related neuropeptide VF [Periophthalmus magnuspinnatus]